MSCPIDGHKTYRHWGHGKYRENREAGEEEEMRRKGPVKVRGQAQPWKGLSTEDPACLAELQCVQASFIQFSPVLLSEYLDNANALLSSSVIDVDALDFVPDLVSLLFSRNTRLSPRSMLSWKN